MKKWKPGTGKFYPLKGHCPGNNDGFTYVEVLVFIAVMSLSAFVLWSGASLAIKTVGKAYEKTKVTGDLQLFEYLLRKEVMALEHSYWINEYDEIGNLLLMDGNVLILSCGDESFRFPDFALDSVEEHGDSIKVIIRNKRGQSHVFDCLRGSFPLGGGT